MGSEENDAKFTIEYRINNPRQNYPTREVAVHATPEEIRQLVEEGYLLRTGLFSGAQIEEMRRALDSIVLAEEKELRSLESGSCFGGLYVRYLMDKDPVFLNLFQLDATLSIAQAVLGPQVQFDQVDARVVLPNTRDSVVPWHIHMRVIPDPLPPFFSYPHALHCLLYLDEVDGENGPLCVLPGSHLRINETYTSTDVSDKPGQKVLSFKAGDCLIMHGNLWHRTLPPKEGAGLRRLVFFGYMPSWMRWNERGGIKPSQSLRSELFKSADNRTRELLGEFYWG